jgi:uncharacterized protein YcbK (DUF882 family)
MKAYCRTPRGALTDGSLRRRDLLRLGALTLAASLPPCAVYARPRHTGTSGLTTRQAHVKPLEKALALYHIHTGETLTTVYWYRGDYLPEALMAISHLLRDYHADVVKPIDLRLLDFLHSLRQTLAVSAPFHVLSGYRSPTTNAQLRQRNRRAARNSLHMDGKAVDISLPGCRPALVRRAAIALRAGGVGYYPAANFVHIDTGAARSW